MVGSYADMIEHPPGDIGMIFTHDMPQRIALSEHLPVFVCQNTVSMLGRGPCRITAPAGSCRLLLESPTTHDRTDPLYFPPVTVAITKHHATPTLVAGAAGRVVGAPLDRLGCSMHRQLHVTLVTIQSLGLGAQV